MDENQVVAHEWVLLSYERTLTTQWYPILVSSSNVETATLPVRRQFHLPAGKNQTIEPHRDFEDCVDVGGRYTSQSPARQHSLVGDGGRIRVCLCNWRLSDEPPMSWGLWQLCACQEANTVY